ncbi:MAG: hypothetical protein ACRDRH_14320 [Pseudonocardia sp.]
MSTLARTGRTIVMSGGSSGIGLAIAAAERFGGELAPTGNWAAVAAGCLWPRTTITIAA